MCPLVDPVLESAAFQLHFRASSREQLPFRVNGTVLNKVTFQICLHRGVRHRVRRSVHQIPRNHSGNIKKKKNTDQTDPGALEENVFIDLLLTRVKTQSSH